MQIGLSAWIIQDGNYKEFEVGREYQFALEFYPHELIVDADRRSEPGLSLISNAIYEAWGVVMFCSDSAWVVDCGVPAYQEVKPPAWAKIGTSIRGRIYIGVDPFFYFESLKFEPGMPNLFRRWLIRRILLETTPWRETTDPQGRKVLSRDAARESFLEVCATDAWNHDEGHGHYLLDCELRAEPAV